MRELVYLSRNRLQEFAAAEPRSWRDRLRVEGEIKLPGVGSVKVGPAEPPQESSNLPDLNEVISALENSPRAARWFSDETLQPGQWLYFEAPLSYMTVAQAVVFLDLDQSTTAYPTGGSIRLMLHGSSAHLVGAAQSEAMSYRHNFSISPSSFRRMFAILRENLMIEPNSESPQQAIRPMPDASVILPRFIKHLSEMLDLGHTSAWMGGYARTTALYDLSPHSRIVSATPLYIEYTTEPSQGT